MAQTRGTFAALYDNRDREVYALLGEQLKKLPAIHEKYFNLETSDRKFETTTGVAGFTTVPEKAEGAAYTTDIIQEGYSKNFTHTEFGLMFEATLTAEEDDQRDVLKKNTKWLAYVARYVMEQRAANVLNNGFTTETAADGSAIFATSHPLVRGGTASNRHASDDDLSATSLMTAMVTLQTDTKLDSGQVVMPMSDLTLLVPPALETTAYRLVKSEGLPGVADNDKNPIKGLRSWTVIVNPLLTDTDAWFVLAGDKSLHGIKRYTRIPVSLREPVNDPRTDNRLYKVRFRASWGADFWQNCYGSAGS